MQLIAYSSRSNILADKLSQELTYIEALAKVHNAKHGITGVLLYFDRHFLQIIEGENAELKSLMHNIERDRRHGHIEYVANRKIEERAFGDWHMDLFNLESGKNFNFDALKKLTESFDRYLPKTDELVVFYRALLGLEEKYRDK